VDQGLSVLSDKALKTAARYYGDKADKYDLKRQGQAKWQREGQMVERLLEEWPRGSQILDIPCGTGRFIPFYERMEFEAMCLDVSKEMLEQAIKRRRSSWTTVKQGSIYDLALADQSVDVSVCIRFLNLIEESDLVLAFEELQRVTRYTIIANVRVGANDLRRYHSPQRIEAIEGALAGWRIAGNEAVHDEGYRMLRIVRLGDTNE
jgi:ubiquinone/menaquinone biosynthesis C-methylase UbiE